MKKTNRLIEHINSPHFIHQFESGLSNSLILGEISINVDDLNFLAKIYQDKAGNFMAMVFGDNLSAALLDACLFLININLNQDLYRLSLRELNSYLTDNQGVEVIEDSDFTAYELFNQLDKIIEATKLNSKVYFDKLSALEKINVVEGLIDQYFNAPHSNEGKIADLIEVDGLEIVVNIKGSSSCSVTKDLEFIQNLLQDKLNCYDINVIPEY